MVLVKYTGCKKKKNWMLRKRPGVGGNGGREVRAGNGSKQE